MSKTRLPSEKKDNRQIIRGLIKRLNEINHEGMEISASKISQKSADLRLSRKDGLDAPGDYLGKISITNEELGFGDHFCTGDRKKVILETYQGIELSSGGFLNEFYIEVNLETKGENTIIKSKYEYHNKGLKGDNLKTLIPRELFLPDIFKRVM